MLHDAQVTLDGYQMEQNESKQTSKSSNTNSVM